MHISTYSEFFRDPLAFALIERLVLPEIAARKKLSTQKELRIWSSACASGEEPYGIAMLAHKFIEENNEDLKCRVFATDISVETLERALEGAYGRNSLKNLPLEYLDRYFEVLSDKYVVRDEIKSLAEFSLFDLLEGKTSFPPTSIYGDFDIVFCANVLIYYDKASRRRIVGRLADSLSAHAYLVSDQSEREIFLAEGFYEIFPCSSIFSKSC